MSCLTTSATRRSRSVPAAVLIASAAASSHEVLLVPMISVTLYTLMTVSFDQCVPPRGAVAPLSQRRPPMQQAHHQECRLGRRPSPRAASRLPGCACPPRLRGTTDIESWELARK